MSGSDFEVAVRIVGKLFHWVATVSWPLVGIFIAATYRQPVMQIVGTLASTSDALKALSNRVTRFGNAEFAQHQSADRVSQGEQLASTEATLKSVVENDPSLTEWIDRSCEFIAQNGLTNATDLKERLIRAWAYTQRARDFDRLGREIFETQIAALRKIAINPSDGRGLRRIHQQHRELALGIGVPEGDILDLKQWMNFLVFNALVKQDNGATYSISHLGQAFLQFADEDGLKNALKF